MPFVFLNWMKTQFQMVAEDRIVFDTRLDYFDSSRNWILFYFFFVAVRKKTVGSPVSCQSTKVY